MSGRSAKRGDTFGDWMATGPAVRKPEGVPNWKYYLPCVCTACGKTRRLVQYDTLTSGRSKGCGCKRVFPPQGTAHPAYQHGLSRSPEHGAWTAMRSRCRNPNDRRWLNYGGKGIKVCARWESFENFYADMGPRPPKHRLGRRNLSKGFNPKNCLWVPKTDPYTNTKAQGGRLIPIAGARARLRKGTEPVRKALRRANG